MIVLFLLIGVVSFVVFQRIKSKRPPAPQYFATPPNKHAIVIGGGISGLLSAGVLSKYDLFMLTKLVSKQIHQSQAL